MTCVQDLEHGSQGHCDQPRSTELDNTVHQLVHGHTASGQCMIQAYLYSARDGLANLSAEIAPTLGLKLHGSITAVFIGTSYLQSQIVYVSDLHRADTVVNKVTL